MFSVNTIEMLAREKEARFIREAEMSRLRNAARGARPRLGARLFSWMGGAFIEAGEWLKARPFLKSKSDMNPCPTCNGNACA